MIYADNKPSPQITGSLIAPLTGGQVVVDSNPLAPNIKANWKPGADSNHLKRTKEKQKDGFQVDSDYVG